MNAGNIVATLRLKTSEFKQGMDKAKSELGSFEKKVKNVSSDFKKVGTVMTAFGTAASVGLGSAVKTAADFESAMSRVGALSGASGKEMQSLTKEAQRLGATTSFSASQAAEGMQYLAMAGWDTSEILEGMTGVLDMAAAGQVELGDAANIASNIMSGFGMEASKSADVADILTKAFTSSNTSLHGLGETMKYAAPAANAVGWSLESTAAAAGQLGDAGIDASMAGTALRSAITRLAAPTKDAAEVLDKFGIATTDANGQLRPLHEILGQMKSGFSDLTDAQKAQAVQSIFGTEAMSAMLTLMEDPEGLKAFTKELENAGGTAEEIARQQMDNLKGRIIELSSAFEGAQIAIGTALIPAIDVLVAVLQKALEWFNSLPESVQSSIAIFMALTAVLSLVGGAMLLFIGFIPNIIDGFRSLSVVMTTLGKGITAVGSAFVWLFTSPIGLTILGIAALAGAVVLLVKNFDVVKEKLEEFGFTMENFQNILSVVKDTASELWETFKESEVLAVLIDVIQEMIEPFIQLGSAIKEVVESGDFTPLYEAFYNLFPMIIGIILGGIPQLLLTGMTIIRSIASGMGMTVPELIEHVTEIIIAMITQFFEMLPEIIDTGVQILTSLIEGIISALPVIIEAVAEIITFLAETIATMLPIILEAGVQILLMLIEGILSILPQLITTAVKLIEQVVTTLISLLPKLIEAGIKILLALIDGIISILPKLITTAVKLIVTVVQTLLGNLPQILQAGVQILVALIEGIISILPSLISAGITLIVELIGAILSNLPQLLSAGVDLIVALVQGVLSVIGAVGTAAADIGRTILDTITGFSLFDVGADLIKGLWNGIGSVKDWIMGKIGGFMDDIVGGFKKFFGIASPSRLFRDEIGAELMNGLQVGIDKMQKAPIRSMGQVSESILSGANDLMGAFEGISNVQIAPPQVGNLQVGFEGMDGAFDVGSDGNGGTNYNAPIVQVDNMNVRDDQDVRIVSRELYGLQRSHDRAKGGR